MDIFDKISESIATAGKALGQSAKNVTDTTRMRSAMNNYESRLCQIFLEIGELCYKKSRSNQMVDMAAPELIKLTAEADSIHEEFTKVHRKMCQAKGIKICPACGAESGNDFLFCPACGKRLAEAEAEVVVEVSPEHYYSATPDSGTEADMEDTGERVSDNTRDF